MVGPRSSMTKTCSSRPKSTAGRTAAVCSKRRLLGLHRFDAADAETLRIDTAHT